MRLARAIHAATLEGFEVRFQQDSPMWDAAGLCLTVTNPKGRDSNNRPLALDLHLPSDLLGDEAFDADRYLARRVYQMAERLARV